MYTRTAWARVLRHFSVLCTLINIFLLCVFQHANKFDPEVVLNQLRYSGMLETVKIRRTGFPVRRTFRDFLSR